MKTTDTLNYNATMNYANTLINNTKNPIDLNNNDMSNIAFGILLELGLKTAIRVSDMLNIEYHQFKENKMHPNTYMLTYSITKTSAKNTVPIGHELMSKILVYRQLCELKYNYSSPKLFNNYSNNKTFTRVWASKKIAKANKLGLMGRIVNVAGMHSVRKTAVNNLFDKTQDLKLAQNFLGHKNILTTSIYLKDDIKTTQDKLRLELC